MVEVQGKLQPITGSESGFGQVLDGIGATMASFSSLVWGQAAPRSAGIRSEQGQDYCGLKDAKKYWTRPHWGWSRVGGENVWQCLPASVGSAAALALILPQPQTDKTKSNKKAV